MMVDIGRFPKERRPLIAGWLSELGFEVQLQDIWAVKQDGQGRKAKDSQQSSNASGDAPSKTRSTGRYLVTLPTSAEAERLVREIHGRKYSVASNLVRRSFLSLPSLLSLPSRRRQPTPVLSMRLGVFPCWLDFQWKSTTKEVQIAASLMG